MDIDMSMARGFEVTLADLPAAGDATIRYVPAGSPGVGADGPLLRISTDDGVDWTAMFADRGYGGSAVTGRVLALPDGGSFCVFAGGTVYLARSDDPDSVVESKTFPVTGFAIADDLLVVATFSYLRAYRGVEEAWTTRDLVADELEILSASDSALHLRGYDPTGREPYPSFAVDVTTGAAPEAPGR